MLWIMNMMVNGMLGTIPKGYERNLVELEIGDRVDAI